MKENGKEVAYLMSESFRLAQKFVEVGNLMQTLSSLSKEELALVDTLQIELAGTINKPKLKDIAKEWIKCNYDYWTNTVLKGLEEGKKVVYYYFTHSPEIYLAMDLVPICAEYQPALASAIWKDGAEDGIDRIEAEGLPNHLCSAQKGTMGWLLLNKVPKPDVIVKPVGICDPSNMAYQWMAEYTGAKFIPVDTPYALSDKAFEYYFKEFKKMVETLEEVSGHELDEDRLREVVECSNEAYEYFLENIELRRAVPCPDPSLSHLLSAGTMLTSVGTPNAISYFKKCRDVAKENAKNGVGVLPEGKTEIRTLWTNVALLFSFTFYDWIEDELGATHLFDCLDWFFTKPIDTSSKDSMIRGIAKRSFNWPMHRQSMAFAEDWINDYIWLAKEYKADCCVFGGHMACKHSWGLNKILSDALKKEVGIPTLQFDMDLADKRFTSIADIKSKMTEFIDTVRKRKELRG
jgi:benzoyl-CoA reductase/2-hydroxyglutaryl-CoA dehydratase subunit BcrC/BadD/HgdB